MCEKMVGRGRVPGTLLGVFVAAVLGFGAPGCGSHAESKTVSSVVEADASPEMERYMPLEDGTVFSYDTRSELRNAQGLLIVQVTRPRTGRIDLHMGSRTERLQLVPDGIAYVEGGYLLKSPLTKGNTWRSRTGMVRVESTDETATVPAGKFEGCLRTVEESRDAALPRTVASIYCPHVGLVMVDVDGMTAEGHDRETAVLKSFGPRVDLTTHSVTTTTDD